MRRQLKTATTKTERSRCENEVRPLLRELQNELSEECVGPRKPRCVKPVARAERVRYVRHAAISASSSDVSACIVMAIGQM